MAYPTAYPTPTSKAPPPAPAVQTAPPTAEVKAEAPPTEAPPAEAPPAEAPPVEAVTEVLGRRFITTVNDAGSVPVATHVPFKVSARTLAEQQAGRDAISNYQPAE